MLYLMYVLRRIYLLEKVDLIVSTGAEIAIPAFIVAKMLRIKTIFIESWCRIHHRSKTGRILYYFSNYFIVQWPQLLESYGNKAIYLGALIE